MVSLLNDGNLPWNHLERRKSFKSGKNPDSFLKLRSSIDSEMEFINLAPPGMKELFIMIFSLQFSEKPPYDEIIKSLYE